MIPVELAAPNGTAALLGSIFQFAPYIGLLVFGLLVGFFSAQSQYHPVAKKISKAIRKGWHIQILQGLEGAAKVIVYETSLSGFLHEDQAGIDMMPDARGIAKFYGTTLSLADAHTCSNFNRTFQTEVEAWQTARDSNKLEKLETAVGYKIGSSDGELAKALYILQKKRRDTRQRLEEFDRYMADQESITEIIKRKKLTKEEGAKYRLEMDAAVKDQGATLKAKLAALDEAAECASKEVWKGEIKLDAKGEPKFSLERTVNHTLDGLWNYIPTSANILAIRTMVNRAVEIRQKEMSQFERAIMKYIGPVMIILALTIGGGILFTLVK